MELQKSLNESEITSSTPEVISWNRPRTTDELLGFIARREAVMLDIAE